MNLYSLFCKAPLRRFILLTAVLLILSGSYFRILENSELDTLDMRFRLRKNISVSDKIAIIEIGDDTIAQLGRFPFDRSYYAILIKALSEYGARAIMFDIFFSEAGKGDIEFEQAIRSAGNVYLPYVFELTNNSKMPVAVATGYAAQNIERLKNTAKAEGHINVIPDADGKYRRVPLFIAYRNSLSYYLSFRLICDYLNLPAQEINFFPSHYIQCGSKIRIPLDENSNILVNYAGEWGKHYKHYSFVDVLRSYKAKLSSPKSTLNTNEFRNKICLIGLTATGTSDLHPNAFASLYPSLGIHADIINAIINNRFVTRSTRICNVIILFLLLIFMIWVIFKFGPLKGLFVLVGLMATYTASSMFLFSKWGVWLDLFYPQAALLVIYLIGMLMMYIEEWKKKLIMESELQIARKIQQSFLPKTLPETNNLEVAVVMNTVRHVGGDLYDFCEFSPDRLGVMIGDVAGKGIPASLFMAMVFGAFKSFSLSDYRPAQTLSNLNEKLIKESSANLFVTMFYAIFNIQKMTLSFSNGGHLPVLYLACNAEPKFLDVEEGYPLGMLSGIYSNGAMNFSKGDVFVFYTDGITEAMNLKSQRYGQERLLAVVQKNRNLTSQGLLSVIENDVRSFESKERQHDDMTCIVIKVR